MFRPSLVLIVLLLLSCQPKPPTKPEKPKVPVDRSAWEMTREIREGKDMIGWPVHLFLSSHTYTISSSRDSVMWHCDFKDRPPTIYFYCTPPDDTSRALEITGTILEVRQDGTDRGSGGVRFSIHIEVRELLLR